MVVEDVSQNLVKETGSPRTVLQSELVTFPIPMTEYRDRNKLEALLLAHSSGDLSPLWWGQLVCGGGISKLSLSTPW